MPGWPGGVMGLGDEAATKTIWDVHAASRALQVRLKSSVCPPNRRAIEGQTEAPVDR
jgi:hypothetical protein